MIAFVSAVAGIGLLFVFLYQSEKRNEREEPNKDVGRHGKYFMHYVLDLPLPRSGGRAKRFRIEILVAGVLLVLAIGGIVVVRLAP